MDRLIDIEDNTRSIAIEALIPKLDGIKIQRELLDGTFHTQTIGESRTEIDFVCYAAYADTMEINEREFRGEPFRVEFEGKYYTGKIKDLGEWQIQIDAEAEERIYNTKIKIVVETEGII